MRKELVIAGKNKNFYSTSQPDSLLLEFKNVATKYDDESHAAFTGKERVRCAFCSVLFPFLESYRIFTHFLQSEGNDLLVKRMKMFPFFIMVRNFAAGSYARKNKIKKVQELPAPVVEFYSKPDGAKKKSELLDEKAIVSNGLATAEELAKIRRMALKTNAVLKSMLARRSLVLADVQLEPGRVNSQLAFGDELSPETMRLGVVEEDGSISFPSKTNSATEWQKHCETVLQRLKGM